MLNQMVAWNKKNGSRLDRDGDNLIDALAPPRWMPPGRRSPTRS